MTLRLAILGTGGMAANHARAFAAIPGVRVVAGIDQRPEVLAAFQATHGIGRGFASLAQALDWGGFDAVTNVTPDAAHYATTMPCLAAGKHVLCEKPLATNAMEAQAMADAAVAAGVVGMVNLSYRSVPALIQAAAMVARGDIGAVRHLEASYLQSWLAQPAWGDWKTEPQWLWRLSQAHGSNGVLGDVGIHILDFATHAIGMMPVSLQARVKTFHKAKGDKIGEYPLDANDSASMQVEFDNGALGVIHASRFMTGYANVLKLDAFGDKGVIEINHGSEWTEIRMCSGEDVHTQAWRRVAVDAVPTIHARFIDAVVSGVNGDPSFRRGATLQSILDRCLSQDATQAASL